MPVKTNYFERRSASTDALPSDDNSTRNPDRKLRALLHAIDTFEYFHSSCEHSCKRYLQALLSCEHSCEYFCEYSYEPSCERYLRELL